MANHFIRKMFCHIQKRFLQSSPTLSPIPPLPSTTTSSSSFTVEFLVNSCGLSLTSALSISNKFQLNDKTPQRPQSVLQFLKSHNFSDSLIAQLIVKRPIALKCSVEGKLRPKFECLIENGFEGELLHHIIASNPDIMRVSLDCQIKPSFEFLRSFISSDDKIVLAVKRAPFLLTTNLKIKFQPIIDVLMKEGVPAHIVGRLLSLQPRSLFKTPEKMSSALNSVKNLGFESTDTMFIHALRVMIQMSESTWKKKFQVLQSMGFSEEDVLKVFKQCPQCLAFSEVKIRKALHFYVNTMELELQSLLVYPNLLGYSIEKRVRPRYHVLKVLESKKLIQGIKFKHFTMGEKNFRDRYIDQFEDEVPGLLGFYLGIMEAKSSVLDAEEPSKGGR